MKCFAFLGTVILEMVRRSIASPKPSPKRYPLRAERKNYWTVFLLVAKGLKKIYDKDCSFRCVINVLAQDLKVESQTILSKESIKQALGDNREILRKYGVKRIGLFGSYVRETAIAASDIDFLVELERLTFDDYMGLALFLEDLFQKDVDLLTPTSIKPGFKPYIEKEVEYVTGL